MPKSARLEAFRARASEEDTVTELAATGGDDAATHTPDADASGGTEEDDSMTDQEIQAAVAAAREEGRKEAADRFNKVLGHENAKGREAHATRLLGRSMSAEEIIDELAHQPLPHAPKALSEDEQRKIAEEAGRKEMQAAMNGGNADIGAGANATDKPTAAVADDVWAQADTINNAFKPAPAKG